MKILVVGGGGREHAIARALACNKETEIFSVMAKRNPGISRLAYKIPAPAERPTYPGFCHMHRKAGLSMLLLVRKHRLKQG